MTAKEYMSQAYIIDRHIKRMIERVLQLRYFTNNTILSDVQHCSMQNSCRREDVVRKIADMEEEIAGCNERLTETKKMIDDVIKRVDNPTYRLLLELRYQCYMLWPDIAHVIGYEFRYTYKLHKKALQQVDTHRHLIQEIKPVIL